MSRTSVETGSGSAQSSFSGALTAVGVSATGGQLDDEGGLCLELGGNRIELDRRRWPARPPWSEAGVVLVGVSNEITTLQVHVSAPDRAEPVG